jgi:hypothetical protein
MILLTVLVLSLSSASVKAVSLARETSHSVVSFISQCESCESGMRPVIV